MRGLGGEILCGKGPTGCLPGGMLRRRKAVVAWITAWRLNSTRSKTMQKIEVILTKGKETKGTYVYEEELGEGGKPPVLKTQYIQKWVMGANPPDRIKVTIEAL